MDYGRMTSQILKSTWIMVGIFFVSSSSALAMGRGSNPCEPAMDEYCGGVLELGHDKLVKCLKEHESDLPADCKVLMEYKKGTNNTTSAASDSSSER